MSKYSDLKDKMVGMMPKHPVMNYSPKAAAAGEDIGKPGKNFKKIAKAGDKKYGKGVGNKIAGSILKKLRAK